MPLRHCAGAGKTKINKTQERDSPAYIHNKTCFKFYIRGIAKVPWALQQEAIYNIWKHETENHEEQWGGTYIMEENN